MIVVIPIIIISLLQEGMNKEWIVIINRFTIIHNMIRSTHSR